MTAKQEYNRQWYVANRELVKERARKRYYANPEMAKEQMRKWAVANPVRSRAIVKAWRITNPERRKELNRKWAAKNYKVNGDRARQFSSNWKRNNPDQVKELVQRYRARKIGATTTDCSNKIKELIKSEVCFWCSEITPRVTIDHVVPLTRGGKHCPDNLVAACRKCNCSKNNKLVSEWRPMEAL